MIKPGTGMQGLWIEQGKISLREDLMLEVRTGEVEARVCQAGICGTDLELLRGYYDFIGVPGHEFVGEVLSAGPWQGKRVVADINFGCGTCEFCHRKDSHHCLHRRTLGIRDATGAFSERVAIPEANLVAVPDAVPNDHAMFAEPLAAALHVLSQVELEQKRVLLVGAGRLGRLVAWAIRTMVPSAEIYVALRSPSRAKRLPPSVTIVATNELRPIHDVAIDCTGNAEGFALALAGLKARGVMVVKSTYADRLHIDMGQIVVNEIQIVGSRCGSIQQAVQFLTANPEMFSELATRSFHLAEYNEAFASANDSTIDKVSFQF